MARVRRPAVRMRTVPGEYIVSRAEAAKRADPSLTYKEIARQFGINERTLRKLRTGETSGRKLFRAARPKPGALPGAPRPIPTELFTIAYEWWYVDSPGFRRWARVNARVARRTIFDIFALKSDPRVIAAVEADLARKRASNRRTRDGSLPIADDRDVQFEIDSVERVATHHREPIVIFGQYRAS